MSLVGRQLELTRLTEPSPGGKARLIVLHGRRRVGKTTLVEHAFRNEQLWKFEGLEGEGTRKQIANFMATLRDLSGSENQQKGLRTDLDWRAALKALAENLPPGPVVLFFDEFQWMASMKGALVSILKWAWDNHFSKKKDLRLILCGSVSSFIVRKVVASKALYGRVSLEIALKPLSVEEASHLHEEAFSPEQIIDLYLCLGGIPQYLLELSPGLSPAQNLQRLAFTPHGYFVNEYRRLFISQFAAERDYERIIRSLAENKSLNLERLARVSGIASGGTLSRLTEDLELAGLIERYRPIDKGPQARMMKLRIADEFLDFHFSLVEPNQRHIEEGTVREFDIVTGPRYDTWQGYAFERLCRRHSRWIAEALGFGGIRYVSGSWFRSEKKMRTQVDLLFDRADRVLTVCEVKNTRKVGLEDARKCEERAALIQEHFRRPIQTVLIARDRTQIPESAAARFDKVLRAEQIFLQPARLP